MTKEQKEAYELLRKFLNPTIQGPNTDAILKAMSMGAADLIYNAKAVHDNMFIMTAEGRFLDRLLADRNFRRPGQVGLSDDDFRSLGVEVTLRKQVQDLISKILDITYGYEYSRSFTASQEAEPYSLKDGDTLKVKFDDNEEFIIKFDTSQFDQISQAKAREIADAITRTLKAKGHDGFADVKNGGNGDYVVIVSPTIGPASSVTVTGGRAQNELKFPNIRQTTQIAGTQVTLSQGSGGSIRATWTGGSSPGFGKVRPKDYVNVYGSGFSFENIGSFEITASSGGSVGNAYVEWKNPQGGAETVTLSDEKDLMFFEPFRNFISSKPTFAAAFQTQNKVLEIYLPALTRIVRRDRMDAAYLADSTPPNAQEQAGNFIYDTEQNFVLGDSFTHTTKTIEPSMNGLLEVDDSTYFPDSLGYLVLGVGTAKQEGPVRYLNRPSAKTLRIDPSYRFKYNHGPNTDVNIVSKNAPIIPDPSGADYQVYLTDMAGGRLYAQEIIDMVTATGITLIFTILYPGEEGLGGWLSESEDGKKQWQEVFE